MTKKANILSKPLLTKIHQIKTIDWAEKKVKIYFLKVIFTEKWCPTFDEPDRWVTVWGSNKNILPVQIRRLQGRGGIMSGAVIDRDEITGPIKV